MRVFHFDAALERAWSGPILPAAAEPSACGIDGHLARRRPPGQPYCTNSTVGIGLRPQ